jgi:tetratricopeptide (TPR) repeat protein
VPSHKKKKSQKTTDPKKRKAIPLRPDATVEPVRVDSPVPLPRRPDPAEAQQRLPKIEAVDPIAAPALSEASAGEPRSATALLDEGRAAFRAEDHVKSEGSFLAALRAGADEAVCRLHLARIYNLRKDWGKALEQWIWLRDQDPGKIEPQLQVTRAQFRLGRYREAIAGSQMVLGLAPDHAEARQKLLESATALLDEGRAAFKAADYTRSRERFLEALRAGADEAVCRLHLARIYNLEEEWPNALEEWKWLRDQTPSKIEPHLQVARAQFRLGRYAEAVAGFEAVLALAPDHTEAQLRLQQTEAIVRRDRSPT